MKVDFNYLSKIIVEKIAISIYLFKMHNSDVHWRDEKSVNVVHLLHYTAIQIRQYFNSNLHQFIWILFYFLDTTVLQKYCEGKSHCSMKYYH